MRLLRALHGIGCLGLSFAPPAGSSPSGPTEAPPPGVLLHIAEDGRGEAIEAARDGRTLVFILAPGDAARDALRLAVRQRKLQGLVTVEARPALAKLPLGTHYANAVWIDDLAAAGRRGLAWPELLRVVVPGGVVRAGRTTAEAVRAALRAASVEDCVRETLADGPSVRCVRAVPRGMGEMDHAPALNAGGRGAVLDCLHARRNFPGPWTYPEPDGPGSPESARQSLWLRWLDDTHRNTVTKGQYHSVLVAGGCFVTVSGDSSIGWARDGAYWFGRSHVTPLVVRDAFNGVVRWSRPCIGGAPRALAADDDTLYSLAAGRLAAERLLDGHVRFDVDLGDREAGHLVLANGVAVAGGRRGAKAFNAADGTPAWQWGDEAIARLLADGGAVYAAASDVAKVLPAPPLKGLAALDARTGAVRWKADAQALKLDPPASLTCAGEGVAVVQGAAKLLVLDGKTGTARHEVPLQGDEKGKPLLKRAVLLPGRLVLVDQATRALDLETGKLAELSKSPLFYGYGAWPCSNGGLVTSGLYEDLPSKSPAAPLHDLIGHLPIGSTCRVGAAAGYQTVYQLQQGCGCYVGRLRGLLAASPIDTAPPREAFERPGELERGPAYDLQAAEPAPLPWPAFRADAARSCAAPASVSAARLRWRAPLASSRRDHAAARHSWRAQHLYSPFISAPTLDGERA